MVAAVLTRTHPNPRRKFAAEVPGAGDLRRVVGLVVLSARHELLCEVEARPPREVTAKRN